MALRLVTMASLLAGGLWSGNTTSAASLDDALGAQARGEFLEAAAVSEALETSEGYALAASSLAIHAHHLVSDRTEKQSLLKRAIGLAEEAVQLDDSNPKAHHAIARAKGRYAETLAPTEALAGGYPGEILASMQRAVELDPDFAEGYLAIGAWNARIVGEAGFLGALAFGASAKQALRYFAEASSLAPDDITVMAGSAIGLLVLDRDKYRSQAETLLGRIRSAPGKSPYDRLMEAELVRMLEQHDGE